jgi:hypothetical protein
VSRLIVVVALVDGARERARALLASGPPFDPGATGLERHHVFLTDHEAIFVFEADAADAVEQLAADESLWAAAAGWSELVAGPPRLAEEVYAWIRAHEAADISFAPTPGQGDSEGGDLFAPAVG